jgi:hypothetical protein
MADEEAMRGVFATSAGGSAEARPYDVGKVL